MTSYSFIAGGSIQSKRLVKLSASRTVVHCGAGEEPIGVSGRTVPVGRNLVVVLDGVARVRAGENLTSGDVVEAGTGGTVVVQSGGVRCGTVIEDCASGEFAKVQLEIEAGGGVAAGVGDYLHVTSGATEIANRTFVELTLIEGASSGESITLDDEPEEVVLSEPGVYHLSPTFRWVEPESPTGLRQVYVNPESNPAVGVFEMVSTSAPVDDVAEGLGTDQALSGKLIVTTVPATISFYMWQNSGGPINGMLLGCLIEREA